MFHPRKNLTSIGHSLESSRGLLVPWFQVKLKQGNASFSVVAAAFWRSQNDT